MRVFILCSLITTAMGAYCVDLDPKYIPNPFYGSNDIKANAGPCVCSDGYYSYSAASGKCLAMVPGRYYVWKSDYSKQVLTTFNNLQTSGKQSFVFTGDDRFLPGSTAAGDLRSFLSEIDSQYQVRYEWDHVLFKNMTKEPVLYNCSGYPIRGAVYVDLYDFKTDLESELCYPTCPENRQVTRTDWVHKKIFQDKFTTYGFDCARATWSATYNGPTDVNARLETESLCPAVTVTYPAHAGQVTTEQNVDFDDLRWGQSALRETITYCEFCLEGINVVDCQECPEGTFRKNGECKTHAQDPGMYYYLSYYGYYYMDDSTYGVTGSNHYGFKCPAGTYDAKEGKGYKMLGSAYTSDGGYIFRSPNFAADKTAIGDFWRWFLWEGYTGESFFYDYHFYLETCRPCEDGYYSFAGQTSCTPTCDKKYTRTVTAGKEYNLPGCFETCPDGTSLEGDTCMPCPEGKTSTAGEACQCPIYSYQNGTCVEACGEDYNLNGTTCVFDKRNSLIKQYREFCDTPL